MSRQGSHKRRSSVPTAPQASSGQPVVPFLLGAAVGGVAGAVVGTLFSGHAAHLFGTLLDVVDRRGVTRERGRPKFEYLQQ